MRRHTIIDARMASCSCRRAGCLTGRRNALRARRSAERTRMTWSIVARAPDGAFGVAVASRFFAVGALCPHAKSGTGALSTQALVNPLYAGAALDAMARGADPAGILRSLTAADDGRDHRQ